MSQADTPPVIKPHAGQLQDQNEKGSLSQDKSLRSPHCHRRAAKRAERRLHVPKPAAGPTTEGDVRPDGQNAEGSCISRNISALSGEHINGSVPHTPIAVTRVPQTANSLRAQSIQPVQLVGSGDVALYVLGSSSWLPAHQGPTLAAPSVRNNLKS